MTEFRLLETEEDGHKFVSLHNLLFRRTNASLEWFRWYFDNIGGSHTRVYGAFDDKDRMIASWCVEPKLLQYDDRRIPVGRCFAVGVHPDHRRQGLFVDISKFAIQRERVFKEYDYILGFPQTGKPVIGGHLKAGWEESQRIGIVSYKPTELPRLNVSMSSIGKVKSFVQVGTPELPSGTTGFIESPSYRNTRWLQHPDNHYVCLCHDDAYVVTKNYGSTCHILDVDGSNLGNIERLLKAVQTMAYRHNLTEVTAWCAGNELHSHAFKATGFKGGAQTASSVELLAVRIKARDELYITGYSHWNMGVEEAY